MAAMLEEPNNKRYLHKNKIYFPKENHSIVSLLQNGCRENTLYSGGASGFRSEGRRGSVVHRHETLLQSIQLYTLLGLVGEYPCDGLPSHPGGSSNAPSCSCYRNQVKFRPCSGSKCHFNGFFARFATSFTFENILGISYVFKSL